MMMLLTSHSIAALSTVPWSLWGVENVVDGSGHSRGAAREEMNDPWQGQSGQESPVVIAPAHTDIHLGYCWGGRERWAPRAALQQQSMLGVATQKGEGGVTRLGERWW